MLQVRTFNNTEKLFKNKAKQITCDLTYKWNLLDKTNEQNSTTDLEIKIKLTVTRGERGGE